MDYTTLQSQIKILLGDTSDKFFTPAEVQASINRVIPEIAQDLQFGSLTHFNYTTADGTQTYALQEDFLMPRLMKLIVSSSDHRTLIQLDLDQFEDVSGGSPDQTGVPIYFKIEMGSVKHDEAPQVPGDIWLYPIPDDNGGSNYTLRFKYYQLPTALSTSTDIPELPLHSHMAIAEKAAADLSLKNGDLALHNLLTARYNASILRTRTLLHQRPHSVRYVNMKDVM